MAQHLLLVEDDAGIAGNLSRALVGHDYRVTVAPDRATALAALAEEAPDLVLLDLGLPDGDGLDLCRAVTALDADLPIIIVTARDDEMDIVVGLEAGAVDYVTKPFRLSELLARIRAHLRRAAVSEDGPLLVGDVRVDRQARRVWLGATEVHLRAKEFDLLAELATRAGTACNREDLMASVWDEHWFGSSKTLDVHISSLRRKLGEEPGVASRITTLRGIGYRMETAEPAR